MHVHVTNLAFFGQINTQLGVFIYNRDFLFSEVLQEVLKPITHFRSFKDPKCPKKCWTSIISKYFSHFIIKNRNFRNFLHTFRDSSFSFWRSVRHSESIFDHDLRANCSCKMSIFSRHVGQCAYLLGDIIHSGVKRNDYYL